MLKLTVEEITPEKAMEYLKKNTNNPRGKSSLSRRIVRQYAEDMKAGLWQLNGEAIVFDKDGYLKNGQHRLAAIILANKPVSMCVIHGVENDTNIYDTGWRRTITQMVNAGADGNFECNATIASAAGLIVNGFHISKSQGRHIQYVRDHASEFERAYRIACYGGKQTSQKSKCAACIAAAYMALRTDAAPSYELELFFRIFNAKNNYVSDGYDPSPALIARRMFDERKQLSGYQIQKEKLEIVTMAIQDFHDSVHREENYKIAEPFHFSEWMNDIRRKDGLEE